MPPRITHWTTAAVAVVALVLSCASPASARTGPRPQPCTAAFPVAKSKTIGKTTWYNRQRSVEYVVCDGFGLQPSADFPITSDFVCALVSQAVGAKAEHLFLFIDGACSADAIASDPKEPATYLGVACGWASDLLEKVATPAGILAGLGCAAAPSVGNSLGSVIESKHELDVAADIIGKGTCLKYSPTHFGSPWLAVTCDSADPGFAGLPQELGTIVLTPSDALGGYTAQLNGRQLPPALVSSRRYLGKPASVKHVGYKRDPECQLTWSTKHITATYYHGYGGVLNSCAPRAGTLRVEFGRGWSTDTGVSVGTTVAELRQTYPAAVVHGSTWGLIESYPPWGATIDVLAAEVSGGRVVSLIVAGPESWDE